MTDDVERDAKIFRDTGIRHAGTRYAHICPCTEDCYFEVRRRLDEARAEIARLTAPPGARATKLGSKVYAQIYRLRGGWSRREVTMAIARAIEAAERRGRKEMRDAAALEADPLACDDPLVLEVAAEIQRFIRALPLDPHPGNKKAGQE